MAEDIRHGNVGDAPADAGPARGGPEIAVPSRDEGTPETDAAELRASATDLPARTASEQPLEAAMRPGNRDEGTPASDALAGDLGATAVDTATDVVQVVDSEADLPPSIRDRLDPSDISAMTFPVEIHDRIMSGGEAFEKFSHYGWNDAGDVTERETVTLPHDPEHPMTWVRESGDGAAEFVFDAIEKIRATSKGGQLTDAEVGQLGKDFAVSDPHEGLALARRFDSGHSPEEARNARYTISFEPGAHVTYIESVVAPQDSADGAHEKRQGISALPGGDKQMYLLDYDRERSSVTVSPVGGRVQFEHDGSMRFGYRDRPLP